MKRLSGNFHGPTADGSPRTTKDPHSLNSKVLREEFYATKESRAWRRSGQAVRQGDQDPPIEPLTVKEVREAVEGRQARRRHDAKP